MHPSETTTQHAATGIMFTSATLAAPDFAPFMRSTGIEHALSMQADSPFDYQHNSLLYVPDAGAPNVKSPEYDAWLHSGSSSMVHAAKGGAFLLFTSNAALAKALEALRLPFIRAGYPVYVQGEGYSKLEIIERVKREGNAVLFATKSFFEGVDIQGDALRLVIIDKMPFAAPSPFSTAQDEHLRDWARANLRLSDGDLKFYPFNHKAVPDMIIDLKQGAGRLIRSHRDRGVIAIMDSRLLTTQYGRSRVLPALPPSKQTNSIQTVLNFFAPPAVSTPISSLAPLDLAKALYAVAGI